MTMTVVPGTVEADRQALEAYLDVLWAKQANGKSWEQLALRRRIEAAELDLLDLVAGHTPRRRWWSR